MNSSRVQLQLLKDLGFRLENVEAGLGGFNRALQKLAKPEDKRQPRQVFLFSKVQFVCTVSLSSIRSHSTGRAAIRVVTPTKRKTRVKKILRKST